ncbi:hypothetical protein [Shewanella sp. YLB-07]|nr:hypothetical protein [Shewanella sp. YLB-07]
MSVQTIITIAQEIASGKPGVRFPAMSFQDWSLFVRCLNEAKALQQ